MITYIVGTDTDVGKTYYGQLQARAGDHVIKPIETGKNTFVDLKGSDSYGYSQIQDMPIAQVNCYFLSQPTSPHLACEIDEIELDLEHIRNFIKSKQPVTVELAGGLMVPLTRSYNQLDLILDTKDAQVDLVVGNKLGCLNHTVLTMDVLMARSIKVNKIIINNLGYKATAIMTDNIKTLTSMYGHLCNIEILT